MIARLFIQISFFRYDEPSSLLNLHNPHIWLSGRSDILQHSRDAFYISWVMTHISSN